MLSAVSSSLISILDSQTISDIASSRLGVPQQAISHSLETSGATLLGGLASKAGDASCMRQLFDLVSRAPFNVDVPDVTRGAIDPSRSSSSTLSLLDSGKKLLALAFGGNQSSIFDAVARATGLQSSVVWSLMGMAAPLMVTELGRLVREDRLNPTGLGRLLADEANNVRELMPSGISTLFNTIPPTTMPPLISTATDSTRPLSITTIPEPTTRWRSWSWLIPLLLLPFLLYRVYRALHPIVPVVTIVRPIIVPNVPGSVLLNIPQGSVAARLLAFVQDPTKSIEQGTRFDFDRLLFDTNSTTLRPGSQEQLRYIAAILKAYPNVHLRIGGHTDIIGSAPRNLKLSQERANSVKAELVGLGISPNRLETQGYGEVSPVADNSTPEGRALNRRISMTVTQK
jgi:outer membrane protein OmpA-like peptidoglycan-associated protein